MNVFQAEWVTVPFVFATMVVVALGIMGSQQGEEVRDDTVRSCLDVGRSRPIAGERTIRLRVNLFSFVVFPFVMGCLAVGGYISFCYLVGITP